MSYHLLLDRPDRKIVLGWDNPLQSFFGVVLDDGMADAGWPSETGIDVGRRFVRTAAHAAEDLAALTEWAKSQIPDEFATEPMAAYHLGILIGLLSNEWVDGEERPDVPLPACLRGARP